ncbi:hypothetical protein R0K30_20220 [Bacillus sp. SIMBA_154]|uniref:hypothetical protein n=1 Tax=Bacillus sp. SIMBA_154 TaxID=3080859 RepID=UPI00397AA318
MTKNKEFQATLPTGEIIKRNSEGGYATKPPGVDSDFEIVVSPDYVVECLVRNIHELQKRQEQILQMRYDSFLLLKRETAQRNDQLSLQYDSYARTIYNIAVELGHELKKEAEGE